MLLKSIDATIKVLGLIHQIHLDFKDPLIAYSEEGEWVEAELDHVGFVNFQFSMTPQDDDEPWLPNLWGILYVYRPDTDSWEDVGELNFELLSMNLNFSLKKTT